MVGAGAQATEGLARVKFLQRSSPKPCGSGLQTEAAGESDLTFYSISNGSKTSGGKASLQPKQTSLSDEKIETILLGGYF